ncbi:MAG: cation:proton antiporter [Ilumatobacteraceae bacterium]
MAAAWAPIYLSKRPLSLPILLVIAGALLGRALPGFEVRPSGEHMQLTEHAAEIGVLVSLLAAGLSIDRRPGWRQWATTWKLLTIAMVLTIAGLAVAGWWIIGLVPASALLLGAVIAPTDPVLASDVQVGAPAVDGAPMNREDEVRFSLTSEAGLNDGLAFPFVLAAVAMATHGARPGGWILEWVLSDLLARIAIGIAVGWLAGKLLSRVVFDPPGPLTALAETTEGFVALGAILLTYGLTEVAHGYGFLAVFIAAVTLRDSRRDHSFHRVLHEFAGQLEQLLALGLLVLFGAAISTGLLGDLRWEGVVVGLLAIFVIRPVAARLALIGTTTSRVERRAIGFFGIRGIGSLYYLAYASRRAEFAQIDAVWSTVAFTVIVSVVVHGVTATPVMQMLDRRRARQRARLQRTSRRWRTG